MTRTRTFVGVVAASLLLGVAPGLAGPASAATGAVYSWGDNAFGQLGDPSSAGRTTPGPGPALPSAVQLAGGRGHVLALLSDGTVVAWGENDAGQLGDGTTTNRRSPVSVAGLSGVTAVYTGHFHSLARTADGSLWSWGLGVSGQLGLGTTTSRTSPARITALSGVVGADGGRDHSIAVTSAGEVWAWGSNAYGEVGDGTTTLRSTPVRVTGLSGAVVVAAARNSSYALTSDGSLWAWGRNDYGQLGLGDTTNRSRPVRVAALSGVVAVTAGAFHVLALTADGQVWAWGFNSYGNLGDGTTTRRLSPVLVPGLSAVDVIETGRDESYAVGSDGVLHDWGRNDYGQLGLGDTTNRRSPVAVGGVTGVTSIAAGRDYAAVLTGGPADTVPPTVPGTPTATSPSPGVVSLSWAASTDDHATTLTYAVYRDGGGTPVGTVSSSSTTTVSYTDSGLAGGSVHTYQVSASDGINTSAPSGESAPVTVQSGPAPILQDDFSGGLSAWSPTNLALDQTLYPASGSPPSVAVTATGMPAYGTRTLPSTYSILCASLDVDLRSIGANSVALMKLRTAAGTSVGRLYVAGNRTLAVRADVSGVSYVTARQLPLGEWHTVRLCGTVGTGGTAGTWTLDLDAVRIGSWSAANGGTPFGRLQLGDNDPKTVTVNYDDVLVTG